MTRWLVLQVCLGLSIGTMVLGGDHPRLLFGKDDVPALQKKIKREPYKSMFERLKKDVGYGQYGSSKGAWDWSCNMIRTGFLYVLTEQDSHARKTRELVEKVMGTDQWANGRQKGLRLYFHAKAVAMAYDWCHGAKSWDGDFCRKVSDGLLRHADIIFKNGGREQNKNPASNWQANRYASAGICYLATDSGQGNVDDCLRRVETYLKSNLGDRPSSGWNIEGYGYTAYPMAHVTPFLIAMRREGKSLNVPAMGNTFWTLAAGTVSMGKTLIHPDFGDDNAGVETNGCLGFGFAFCPKELQPGLLWCYDRMVGKKGIGTFEADRAGTVFSLMYAPDNVKPADPIDNPAWRKLFEDPHGNGMYLFRNQYAFGGQDMVAQFYAKLRGNKGHNGPDALSFRIQGLSSAWAVGGGRYGRGNIYHKSMNTLYPEEPDKGRSRNGNSGRIVGSKVVKDGGGYVIASIKENNVGTRNHKRWFAADHTRAAGVEAVYLVADTSDNGRFWQMCVMEKHEVSAKGNTFTIRGNDGATLQGTVVHPASTQIKLGKRRRGSDFVKGIGSNRFITFPSDDGDHLVVLTVAKKGQKHPKVSGQGKGALQAVKVGGLTLQAKDTAVARSGKGGQAQARASSRTRKRN